MRENADLIARGQAVLNFELGGICQRFNRELNAMRGSTLDPVPSVKIKSSFARYQNVIEFKEDMLERYRHLGDTLIWAGAPALRVFGGECAASFPGVDLHIRFKRQDGSFGTFDGLLAFIPLDTDDAEECFQLFSYDPAIPKVLVHVARGDIEARVVEACARDAMM